MELKQYLVHLYNYNYWANHRYLKAAEALTEEQLFRKHGHSWDSVHGVLLHMLSSETVWYRRWHGESPKRHLAPGDFLTLKSIIDRWAIVEQQMRDFTASQNEQSLSTDFSYTNFQGITYHFPLWQSLPHVPNHNTHHRGELAAMFAIMDAPHPEDEVVQYFLFTSEQSKA